MTLENKRKSYGVRPVPALQAAATPGSLPRGRPPKLLRGHFKPSGTKSRRHREKQGGEGISPHKSKPKERVSLKVMHWNAEGVAGKIDALEVFLHENKVDVCCIQETHLTVEKNFKIRGYQKPFRNDRIGRKKGGVMTLVRNGIQAIETQKFTGEAEYLNLKLATKKESFNLVNYYCPDDKRLSLDTVETSSSNFLIAGDFNSHEPLTKLGI